MKKKVFVVALTVSMIGASPAFAWGGWGSLLHPGDHVIDFKRLADSIKETAEYVKVVANEIANLKNRILANTKLDMDYGKVIGKVETDGCFPKMGDITANRGYKPIDDMYHDVWNAYGAREPYLDKLHKYLSGWNQEIAVFMGKIKEEQVSRGTVWQEVLSVQTPGIVGEKQRENNLSSLEALDSINQAQITGAEYMRRVAEQEAEATHRRIDDEEKKAASVYAYDPFHPTEYDNKHNGSKSQNVGFMKFGQ